MGYTHYWYRKEELPVKAFKKILSDIEKIIPELEKAGIPLADGHGKDKPVLRAERISFNGVENCGHASRDLGITWPSPTAGGAKPDEDTRNGYWFAGALLEKRTCGGDCSHESFWLERVFPKDTYRSTDEAGRFFSCTKTAYKPYDIAVTAALIIAKHYLRDMIKVSSDGEDKDWFDGKMVCHKVLGYGLEYELGEELEAKVEAK